ncbi:sensor histidine kinase [Helicobacter cholecystus]|nr:HAMP domain-containing sensor histidine kinase [Helicobacter cholecystus]
MKELLILKEMAIVLIKYEKHALVRFLGFYIVSFVLLVGLIAFLVFLNQREQIYKSIHTQMLLKASQIAQKAISLQMIEGYEKIKPDFFTDFQEPHLNFSLFDKDKKLLYGNLPYMQINGFVTQGNNAYLLSNRVYGHLGIEWILINFNFSTEIENLIFSILVGALVCLVFVMLFGIVLGKMFLKPIRDGVIYLDHFIKDITHELNTPISALMMSVESLQSGVNEVKISRIQKACKRIAFLYSNLTFLFLGDLRECKEEIEFVALLKSRIEMFEEHLNEKAITLSLSLENELNLFANTEAVCRMIDNLLSNAIKHNIKGGNIHITLKNYIFCIQNSGTPIPQELRSVFKKRYKRGDLHTQGYGIGLDIVQKVVQNNCWKLQIDSTQGLNTFIIYF